MSDFGVPAFADLISAPTLERIRANAVRRCFADGERTHHRGDSAGTMDLVVSGQVKIYRLSRSGQETFVATINPGQNYGDFPAPGVRRTHCGVAIGPTVIEHFPLTSAAALLTEPEAVAALYRISQYRLSQALELLDDLRSLPPPYQLARLLLILLRGAAEDGAIAIRQEDLASMLGVSVVTLAKLLATLRGEALIETGYRRVRVPDRDRLAAWIAEFVQD